MKWRFASGYAALSILLAAPVAAIGEWESDDGEVYLSLAGAERLTAAFFHTPPLHNLYPAGDDGLAASVTRLLGEGVVGDHIRLEANAFLDISRRAFGASDSAFSTAGSVESPYRTPYLTGRFWTDGAIEAEAGLDRLSVTLSYEPVTITLGRTPVNHSVTTLFSPNDFFAPFSTTAINTVYKPGVDALALGFAPGTLSLIQLTGVLGSSDGDAPGWADSALLLHARAVLYETEIALLCGKLAERWVVGASMQAPAGRFNLRAEGHAGFPDLDGDLSMDDLDGDGRARDSFHARLTVGVDTFFTWHNSSLGAAYMYLSDGASEPSLYLERAGRFHPDDQPFLGRHYAGLTAATEITPLLRSSLVGIVNLEDGSGVAVATFAYSLSDEADFVAGVLAPFGERQTRDDSRQQRFQPKSEHGHLPLSVFLESRFYF